MKSVISWSAAALLISVAWVASSLAADIAVSSSGHYVMQKGKPVVLVGESGTQCVLQNANINYRRWLDDCAACGHTCVHVWSFVAPRQRLDGTVVENRYGYVYPGMTPWARKSDGPRATDGGYQWDLLRWDEGDDSTHYWPRLRDLCKYAERKRLLVGITVFWGWPKHPADWAYHPFNACNGGPVTDTGRQITQVQVITTPGTEVWEEPWNDMWPVPQKNQWHWERFAKKLIDETQPFSNVFFVFMDEHSYSEGNGGNHFLRFFKNRGAIWVDCEPRRAHVDFVYVDVPYRAETGKNTGALKHFFREPPRPVLILEGGPYQGDEMRFSMWTFLMGGGHYILHNDEGQETVHTGIMGYDPNVPGNDTGQVRRRWLGHAARFFNEGIQNLDAMTPCNELTGTATFCLAEPGQEYVLYSLPSSDTRIRLDLTGVGATFRIRFYDPSSGEWRDGGACTGDEVHQFAKPTLADWAVHLSRRQ